MTDKISNEARELYEWLEARPCYPRREQVKRIEYTITAARNQALEDAEKHLRYAFEAGFIHAKRDRRNIEECDAWDDDKDALLKSIRAMKVHG